MPLRVAFTGTSGSGKTTLVKYVEKEFNLPHISGSAYDLKEGNDRDYLESFGFPGGGHAGTIKYSALNPEYGIMNQRLLLKRRTQLIQGNNEFVTDRSPLDNVTYFINQCGFHPMVTDGMINDFIEEATKAWMGLTHIIYVKAVQPYEVENNNSRVANIFYQKAMDVQFDYWYKYLFANRGPKFLKIDYWNLQERKENVREFLTY
jgi:energy-coupling factor transporter ATP-binding protein EcfA2